MALEQLWAGWRHEYVVRATDEERQGSDDGCVFCRIAASGGPSAANHVVWRGDRCLCVLNLYPYATGHMLIVPVDHVEDLDQLAPDASADFWHTVRVAVHVLEKVYEPDGVNVGANLGRAAGAGIPKHLHFHVLPRWSGDTNFMTAVAGVRVIPETLETAWERLYAAWPKA
jgi:ATP adenylyltransferase